MKKDDTVTYVTNLGERHEAKVVKVNKRFVVVSTPHGWMQFRHDGYLYGLPVIKKDREDHSKYCHIEF